MRYLVFFLSKWQITKKIQYLFILGWEVWLGDVEKFKITNDLGFELKSEYFIK